MKTKRKVLRGAVLMAGASKIWQFVKSNLLREYDVDLLELFNDFSQQASSFVRSTAVCSATFRRDMLLQLYPYHIMSAVTALQAAAQLDVACPIFCVLRDEHLSIDRPVHFSPGLLPAKASPPDVEMERLVALRYGGESASVPGCLCDGTGTVYHLFSVT